MRLDKKYYFLGYNNSDLFKVKKEYFTKYVGSETIKFENFEINKKFTNLTDFLINQFYNEKLKNTTFILNLDALKNINLDEAYSLINLLKINFEKKVLFVTNNPDLLKKTFVKGVPNVSKENIKLLFETLNKITKKDFNYELNIEALEKSIFLYHKKLNILNIDSLIKITFSHITSPLEKLIQKQISELKLKKDSPKVLISLISLRLNSLKKLIQKKNAFPKKEMNEILKQYISLEKQRDLLVNHPSSKKAKEIILNYKKSLQKTKKTKIKTKLHNSSKFRKIKRPK